MIARGFSLKKQAGVQLFKLEKEIKDPENIHASQCFPVLPSGFQCFPVVLAPLTKLKWGNSSAEEGRLSFFPC